MDWYSRPLRPVLQHDLKHGHAHGFSAKAKHSAEREFAMPFLLVVQELIADKGGDVGRVTPEVHLFLARIVAAQTFVAM